MRFDNGGSARSMLFPRSACGKAECGGEKMRWDEIPRFTSCRNYGVEWSLFRYFCEYIDHETQAGLVLNPDFQRGHVWTEEQQTAYIEYLLMGGLSGRTVYLNAKDIGSPSLKARDYVCVDGLQRITAIRRFTAMRFRRSNIATVSLRGN